MKSRILVVFLVIVLAVSPIVFSACKAPAEVKTAKIGFLAALSGEAAPWGLPGLYGLQIWVEEVNAAGGIQVGNEKYKVEIVTYDDENTPSKCLLGARKLVLEDKVNVLVTLGGSPVHAILPFLTQQRMLDFDLNPSNVSINAPYLVSTAEDFPAYFALGAEYIAKTYPEIKTVAFTNQDDFLGVISQAYSLAGYEAAGIEVVYNRLYAMETTDFAPIVTAILATAPDMVSLGCSYPSFNDLLTEQLYLHGYEGLITSVEFVRSTTLAKVPADWLEARHAVSHFPTFDDPMLSEKEHKFYAEYMSRWPEAWGAVSWEYAASMEAWKYGVELAGSVEPMAVYEALKAADTVPQPFGEGTWQGTELFGIDNWLAKPWPITEFYEGNHHIVTFLSFADWYKEHGDILLKYLEEAGLLWWQL
jgi:branched-chain amino acid transport system substrate-binding protein